MEINEKYVFKVILRKKETMGKIYLTLQFSKIYFIDCLVIPLWQIFRKISENCLKRLFNLELEFTLVNVKIFERINIQ